MSSIQVPKNEPFLGEMMVFITYYRDYKSVKKIAKKWANLRRYDGIIPLSTRNCKLEVKMKKPL